MIETRMSTLIDHDYRQTDPFRHPAWRWRRAIQLVRQGHSPRDWEDPAIGTACEYLYEWATANTPSKLVALVTHHPRLTIALDFSTVRDHLTEAMEMGLAAGDSSAAIAKAVGTIPEIVETFARYFFDVEDRTGQGPPATMIGSPPARRQPHPIRSAWRFVVSVGRNLINRFSRPLSRWTPWPHLGHGGLES